MEALDTHFSEKLQDLDALWNVADLPGSEAQFRDLLPYAQKLADEDPSHLIEVTSFIARSEALQKKYREAHASLDSAERLLNEKSTQDQVSAKMRWLIEKGRLHILEKTPSQARILFSEAWALAIRSGEDYFAVEIAQLMAVAEPPKAQQEWINRAIEIAEASSLPKAKRWLGSLYTSLGWKLYDLRQFEKALAIFQKALEHFNAQGTPREAFVAQWSIGKVLRTLGKIEEALTLQKQLLENLGIAGERDGRLYEELAECFHTLKRTTEAQTYFELAYRELSNDEWISDNQPLKLKRMKDLGKVK